MRPSGLGWQRSLAIAIPLLLAGFLLIVGVVAISVARGESLDYVFRDVVALCSDGVELGPLAGALSSMGILLWTVAASAGILASTILRRRQTEEAVADGWLMLALGLFSSVAAIDDQFMLHESLWRLGLPQWLYPIAYGGSILLLMIAFRNLLVQRDVVIFLMAVTLMALSVLSDTATDVLGLGSSFESAFEDSLKSLGIVMWTTYIMRASVWRIERAFLASPAEPVGS